MLKLYYISDRSLTPGALPHEPILAAVRAGVDMVQIREKDLSARARIEMAREVIAAAAPRGVETYVSSRFDIAMAVGASGAHLPADGLAARDVRRKGGSRIRIGVSTHGVEEAMEAEWQGADFITFGPVFDTPSKRRYGAPVGLAALAGVLDAVRLPVFALGGITIDNVAEVAGLPVAGIGMISGIALAPDRAERIAGIRAEVRRVRGGDE
ncbi:MAG: thiamine phosphate synthase [Acidobacteria bacterium]|nr:thiamine phosphate synthase [Acidobacteriota bacterium]